MTPHTHSWYGARIRRAGWLRRRWVVTFACACGATMEADLARWDGAKR